MAQLSFPNINKTLNFNSISSNYNFTLKHEILHLLKYYYLIKYLIINFRQNITYKLFYNKYYMLASKKKLSYTKILFIKKGDVLFLKITLIRCYKKTLSLFRQTKVLLEF